MSKTRISLAVLSAFALGAAAPLFAAESTSAGDRPSAADPPAGERIPAVPGSPQTSGDTSSRTGDPAAATKQGASGNASVGDSGQQSEVRPQTSTSSQTRSQPSGSSSSQAAGSSAEETGMGHPALGTRSHEGEQMQSQSDLEHPALDNTQAGQRNRDQQVRGQMSGMPGAERGATQAQPNPYRRQSAKRDRPSAQWREDWSAMSRTGVRRDPRADTYRYDPRAEAYRYDPRYDRSNRGWDAMGEFDERDRMVQDPGFWRDIEEGSGYTYRDDYYGPSARYDYGPRAGRDYYSDRDARWRGRGGGMMERGSDYRDDYARDDWRRDYYTSERDRYRDQWSGRGGARGGWDDRWRGAPGDRMGQGPYYPDYQGAVPGERYWRDQGDWRDSGQWRDSGPRGGRWHGDQWSSRYDDGRMDPGRANMGPGSVAGRDWDPESYREGPRGRDWRAGDWRAEQWRGSPGGMSSER